MREFLDEDLLGFSFLRKTASVKTDRDIYHSVGSQFF